MIDAHTHLADKAFDADRNHVMMRALTAGVKKIAVMGEDFAENEKVLVYAQKEKAVLPFLGFHPDRYADRLNDMPTDNTLADLLTQIRTHQHHITGIGEVGLDHWVCQGQQRRDAQEEGFCALIDLAIEHDLPLNVHSRSAGRHTIETLLKKGATRVLMHAFDGRSAKAMAGVEAGYLFSIPPSIVRSPQKQKLVKQLPLHALALETDSPVLGVTQAERNEPANVCTSLAVIAEIKQLPIDEVEAMVTANIKQLFGLTA